MMGRTPNAGQNKKRPLMRRLPLAAALLVLACPAFASDFEMPTLRGSTGYEPTPFVPAPPTFMRWSGFYGGAHAGYGNAHVDFAEATESLVEFMLRVTSLQNEQNVSDWQVLGKRDTGGASGGGFVGYNSQWDDVVLGVELMYSKTNFSADAPADPIRRITSAGGNGYDVTVDGNASMRLNDYGTARLRAGYVMRTIMPWAMVGVAVGRMDYKRSATVDGIENPGTPLPCGDPAAANCSTFNFSKDESKKNAFIYGWTAGLGVDVMLLPHLFLRAEYEYTTFTSLAGIKPSINTGRVGAAYKF
jgi:opacity protein-like surface antigen